MFLLLFFVYSDAKFAVLGIKIILLFWRGLWYTDHEMGDTRMLDLFVRDAVSGMKVRAFVETATEKDFASTSNWQTNWLTPYAVRLPNKVALRRVDYDELLGLMSYEMDERSLAVEIIYIESAHHSNANLLRMEGGQKRYTGIAKALFAYAVQVSLEAGCDGVLVFKAKNSDLLDYYMREFGARQVGSYDPFRLVVWEDAAEEIIAEFRRNFNV